MNDSFFFLFFIHTKAWQYSILENVSMEKLFEGSLKNNMGVNHVFCTRFCPVVVVVFSIGSSGSTSRDF